jgi:RimJ/RimL family protein N-acetyltransferase
MDERHRDEVRTILRWLKDGPPGAIPLPWSGPPAALSCVTWEDAGDRAALARLARWRASAFEFFPARLPRTRGGTRRWLVEEVLDAPERILFWVCDGAGAALGHLGLARFDFAQGTAEVDDVLRGTAGLPGLMGAAIDALAAWSFEALRLRSLLLRVLAGNDRALRLSRRCGFDEVQTDELPPDGRSFVTMQRWSALAA